MHHSIWKILFVLGADEYLETLEGKIGKCFYVKIFSNNSVNRQGTWGFKKYSYIWYLYWNEKENKTAVSENIFHQYVPIVRVLPLHFVVWREFTREFRFSKKSAVAKIVHSTLCSFLFRFYNNVRSVIIHKSRGEQFLWNRNWDLGWIWADYKQLLRVFFFMFSGAI